MLRACGIRRQHRSTPPAPKITLIINNGDGSMDVFFDADVLWTGALESTLQIGVATGTWQVQVGTDNRRLRWGADSGIINSGDLTSWVGPDPELIPSPDPSQSGPAMVIQ